jgi:hypothetical protein
MITFGTARSVSAEARVLAFAPLGRTLEVGPTRLFVAVVGARLVDLRLVKRNDDESHALKSVNRSIRLKPYDFSPSSVSVDSSRSAAAAEDDKEQKKETQPSDRRSREPPSDDRAHRMNAPPRRVRATPILRYRPFDRHSNEPVSRWFQTSRGDPSSPETEPVSRVQSPRSARVRESARARQTRPSSVHPFRLATRRDHRDHAHRRDAITTAGEERTPAPAVVRDETMKTR